VNPRPKSVAILGPAGYGTTTLLMILATELVKQKAGPVFMLKPGARFIEGDVEFAISLFAQPAFFFVDNAADHGDTLRVVIQLLRDQNRTAMFVLGERLNEWRQSRVRIYTEEYEVEPLSDIEIENLLDCLEKHHELNQLQPLARKLQALIIKSKYGKELLVALREATEGKDFDAILEDEYRGINNSDAQRVYLTVSCFYQHGAFIRDGLLSKVTNIPLSALYDQTGPATEGVVIYECVDEGQQLYGGRARHRTIARVVWERCGSPASRERILLDSLEGLNLNYQTDLQAFQLFFRSDHVVNGLRSLDDKIRFFDTACRKEPENPYVRQHYARMLLRERKYELALGQVEEALRLNPRIKILYHTKGTILARLAIEIESPELARRRLVQSEAAFRTSIGFYDKDDYDYQGLAQLYFSWAKRMQSDGELTDYVSKAETVISEGLRKVKQRASLWIISAEIQSWLRNEPSRLGYLEKAVRDSPGSIIARYLLGRAYRRDHRPEKAIDVLEPVIANHPEEFRSFVEYALARLDLHSNYEAAVAILRIGASYGMRDPRFIATLGGMLFMKGEFSEAERIFGESTRREFSVEERRSIQFRPKNLADSKRPMRMRGEVVRLRAGYAILRTLGYPEFLCPGSKFREMILHPGLQVSFEPAFAAQGPVADSLEPPAEEASAPTLEA
jgi:tetratricopeptide (TPR) repeat protein